MWCEWENIESISDLSETRKLDGLVEGATRFIRSSLWAVLGVTDGKGPFEPSGSNAPNFIIVHSLRAPCACCLRAVVFVF